MSYNWNDRPTKAETRSHIGGDAPASIYRVGKYEVTIPGPEIEGVTYRVPYHTNTDPRQTFANMDITDGEIRIPVSDLVDEVLSRIEPVELAEGLWSNAEVREHFIDKLTDNWNTHFTDQDRRDTLHKLREEIHDKTVGRFANAMHSLEYAFTKKYFFYHEVNSTNDYLRNLEQSLREKHGDETITIPRLRHEDHDPDFKISGTHYDEARKHWRDEIRARFPGPLETDDSAADEAA